MIASAASSAAILALLLASGGTRDRIDALEQNMGDLRQQMAEVRQEQDHILQEIEKLNQRLGVEDQQGIADLQVRLDGVDQDVRVLFENLNDLDSRFRRMEERLDAALTAIYQPAGAGTAPGNQTPTPAGAGPTIPPLEEDMAMGEGEMPPTRENPQQPGATPPGVAAAPPGVTPAGGAAAASGGPVGPSAAAPVVVDPQELYQTAYTDFARGNYDLAILGFQDYVKRFPDTDLADNAQYWIGESQYSQGRYLQAVQAFQDVETRYPQGDKVPDAILKKGYALIEMNQIDEGIRELQRLISQYPRSNAARIARQRLRSMGLPTP